jgi:hypothetical protein|tara:strand:- start:139 stop:426 length:288 start_codon:yes stop_codon:yes gene_type:complete
MTKEEIELQISDLLNHVKLIIMDRHERHGDSTKIHQSIADMMAMFVDSKFDINHVFAHNILTKVTRLMTGSGKKEHIEDIIGYAILWNIHMDKNK